MNLREQNGTGYPPPDNVIRTYLSQADAATTAHERACGFLKALFDETAEVLLGKVSPPEKHEPISLKHPTKPVSEQFREYMMAGMSMTSHGQFHNEFYRRVILRANTATVQCAKYMADNAGAAEPVQSTKPTAPVSPSHLGVCTFPPNESFAKLAEILQKEESPLSTKAVSKKATAEGPLVVLEFDESHMLMKPASGGNAWSNFGELCRALRALSDYPLFSLFLSTTRKINQFIPSKDNEPSLRIIFGDLILIHPFTDLGLDQLARFISFVESKVSPLDVVTTEYISHLGRLLWGARYDYPDSQIQQGILAFAVRKLVGMVDRSKGLGILQKLACLAQRLPIEFKSITYLSHVQELEQIESYMRVCIRLDAGLESMTSASPSEPILSEAAYWMMQDKSFNAPDALMSILHGFSIDKGARGELLVMLLFTMARDAAVGNPDSFGMPTQRWNTVPRLLEHLFCTPSPASEEHVDILACNGSELTPSGRAEFPRHLKETFADSKC
ncbi:hypothetical protein SCP_0800210 [Sparassis crispa]|uniref:Uncharacterized protein n=1 Tax=Sparassis crispa TaxID=139825 RepID=A0A401GUU5_9APHY|nr:hypothetical protein SCP_0800210 [Sparassis crispa]GBE85504.1 hypothetical protein SCP_0800210 [Sparassis crispa]